MVGAFPSCLGVAFPLPWRQGLRADERSDRCHVLICSTIIIIISAISRPDDAIPLGYLMDASKANFTPNQSQKALGHLIKGAVRGLKGIFSVALQVTLGGLWGEIFKRWLSVR